MNWFSIFAISVTENHEKNLILILPYIDPSMSGYYDYVLGLIPAALIGVTAALYLAGMSTTAALPGGALVAGAIMAHAMFVRAPIRPADVGGARSDGGPREPTTGSTPD